MRTAIAAHKPRVLYYHLRSTFGKGTIFDELVQIAGGINVAAEMNLSGFQNLSAELIPTLNADIIIMPQSAAEQAVGQPQLPQDPAWQKLQELRKIVVRGVPEQHLSCISHHVVKAAADLGHVLHPKLVPAQLPIASGPPEIAE